MAAAGAAGIVTCKRWQDAGTAVASGIAADAGCDVRFVKADLGEIGDCRAVAAGASALPVSGP